MTSRNNKSVSLVLGSGGARGLAHIGIIEWLNDNGYDIQSISGSSMGALVGGIYAAGKLDNYRDWVQSLDKTDVVKFLDFSFSSTGLFKGDRIIDNLRKMVGNHLIEDLSIGFTAVATDLERQREVWFTRGPLFDAIRASIAVPTIFTPHKYKGRYLLDGGLLNPVPIAPTFKDMTDLTIAVDLNGPAEGEEGKILTPVTAASKAGNERGSYMDRIKEFFEDIQENMGSQMETGIGLLELVTGSIETMQNAISSIKLATYPPDVLIKVPRDVCAMHEFHKAQKMCELGYRIAGEAMQKHRRTV